jgi:hypothetical protein
MHAGPWLDYARLLHPGGSESAVLKQGRWRKWLGMGGDTAGFCRKRLVFGRRTMALS